MYDIFTYIYHELKPTVGKYTIHGAYGEHKLEIFRSLKPNLPSRKPAVLNRFNGTWTSLTKNLFRWNWINPWLCSRGQIKGFCWKDSWCFYSPPVKWELLIFMLVAISSSFSLSFSFASSSSLRLHSEQPRPVFPAPQLRSSEPSVPCQTSTSRTECQKRMSEDMSGRMPDRMPGDAGKNVRRNVSQRECKEMCQKGMSKMSDNMSEKMSEDVSESISDRMLGDMPEWMSERVSEQMSDRMTEDMSERIRDRLSDNM